MKKPSASIDNIVHTFAVKLSNRAIHNIYQIYDQIRCYNDES